MGTDQNEAGKGKGKSRGSTNNAGRLKALLNRTSETAGSAEWTSASPEWIVAVIAVVNKVGGAVSFGLSRDQGAHSLMILLDGERETLWFNGEADLDAELEKVYHMFLTD